MSAFCAEFRYSSLPGVIRKSLEVISILFFAYASPVRHCQRRRELFISEFPGSDFQFPLLYGLNFHLVLALQ